MRNTLKLEKISFGYLNKKNSSVNPVLDNFELTLKEGEIGIVLGPSGGGKTTILRAIAGFLDPIQGTIKIDGRDVFNSQNKSSYIPSEQRNVGMVFQDFALFPHLNVKENIIFALTKGRLRFVTEENIDRVEKMLSLTGMTNFAESSIQNLSGGQKQRVALARALAPSPKLILFDEPFSNLDPALRQALVKDVREMLKATSTTALFVTHDQLEAFSLGDRVGILKDGQLQQWDSPYRIYHEPKNIDIAKFIGQGALINGFQDGDTVTTALGKLTLKNNFMSTRKLSEKQVKVLIRPDDIIHDDESNMSATVVKKIFRGADFLYTLKLPTEEEVLSFVPSHHDHPLHKPIGIRLEVDHVVTFDSTEPSFTF
ncbi:MAG: ABC transporter ATP-binding protein [Burkholderiaceae bacterium]|nr:MAG: ABC transporter ATP-binding protein [Burkholderiaceae bacterium]